MLINVYNAKQTVPYAVRKLCCTNGILYGRYAAQTVFCTDAMLHKRYAVQTQFSTNNMLYGRYGAQTACCTGAMVRRRHVARTLWNVVCLLAPKQPVHPHSIHNLSDVSFYYYIYTYVAGLVWAFSHLEPQPSDFLFHFRPQPLFQRTSCYRPHQLKTFTLLHCAAYSNFWNTFEWRHVKRYLIA